MKKEEQYMELPFKVGDVFKNYKILCEVLGERVRKGGARKSHLKRWRKYFEWRNEGHKMIITEIYTNNYPTHDNNQLGKRTKEYSKYLQKIILFLLYENSKESKKYHTFLSRKTIVLFAEMVRNEFYQLKQGHGRSKELLAEELKEHIYIVEEILDRIDRSLTSDVNTALNQLKQQKLIEYEYITMVTTSSRFEKGIPISFVSELTKFFNDDKLYQDLIRKYSITAEEKTQNVNKDWKPKVRPADETERASILYVQKFLLEKWGMRNLQELYQSGRSDKFFKEVNKLLKKYVGIKNTFKSYSIVYSPYFIEQEIKNKEGKDIILSKGELEQLQKLLKYGFSKNVKENALKFYNRVEEKHEKINSFEYIGFTDERPFELPALSYNEELIGTSNHYSNSLDEIIKRVILD